MCTSADTVDPEWLTYAVPLPRKTFGTWTALLTKLKSQFRRTGLIGTLVGPDGSGTAPAVPTPQNAAKVNAAANVPNRFRARICLTISHIGSRVPDPRRGLPEWTKLKPENLNFVSC